MGAGKRARAFSASHLEKGEIKLFSRPSSRNYLTQEWITSMRQKGIIISDAEMRYRKWLALSNSRAPSSLATAVVTKRPLTAPAPLSLSTACSPLPPVKENRCSKLRQQSLPEPHAELNTARLVQQKQSFDKQCRSFTPMVIRTDNFPQLSEATPHQFLVGSRYNYSQIIDSRSLTRLGVYVPRNNLAGTFVNPAGISPSHQHVHQHRHFLPQCQHNQMQEARVESVISPTPVTVENVPKSSLLLEVQQCIRKKERPLSSTANTVHSFNTASIDPYTDEQNNSSKENSSVLLTADIHDEEPTIMNVVDSSSATAHADEIQQKYISTNSPVLKHHLDEEELLEMSSEATNITLQILEDTLTSDNDVITEKKKSASSIMDDMIERKKSASSTTETMTEGMKSTTSATDIMMERMKSTTSATDIMTEGMKSTTSATDIMTERMKSASSTTDIDNATKQHQQQELPPVTTTPAMNSSTTNINKTSSSAVIDGDQTITAASETSIHKSSSTIVVDMTQLNINTT